MRILWITHVYPRFPGDMFGGFLHRLASELASRGLVVDVVAPWSGGAPEQETRDGVRIARFRYPGDVTRPLAYSGEMHRRAVTAPIRFLRFVGALAGAASATLGRTAPEIVHAHWWAPCGIVARRVAWEKCPIVVSIHGTDARLTRRFPLVRPIARWAFRGASRVLPVSAAIADQVRADAGTCSVETLPMPVDADVFGSNERGRVPEVPTFVVAARLTGQKRVIDAVRALGLVRSSGIPARLIIAGDGPERGALESAARDLGAESAVDFRGVLTPSELANVFRMATAVVLPSELEGYGLSIVEAGLCGAPGIGTRSGGIPDVIAHESTGLLVPARDPAALAAAMMRLSSNPEEARTMGDRARRFAESRTAAPLAKRLHGIYQDVVSEWPLQSTGRGAGE